MNTILSKNWVVKIKRKRFSLPIAQIQQIHTTYFATLTQKNSSTFHHQLHKTQILEEETLGVRNNQ